MPASALSCLAHRRLRRRYAPDAIRLNRLPQRAPFRRRKENDDRTGIQQRADRGQGAQAVPRWRWRASRADHGGALRAVQGLRRQDERDRKLDAVDRSTANQIYATCASLRVDLSFAIGGVKNHEIYFGHLGGKGGSRRPRSTMIKRDFPRTTRGSRLQGLGPRGARLGVARLRPRLATCQLLGDAQNTFPLWNATPILALDVYEHAYWIDLRPRARQVHRRVLQQSRLGRGERLGRGLRHTGALTLATPDRGRVPRGQHPHGVLGRPRVQARGHPDARQRRHRRDERLAGLRRAGTGCP